MTAEQMGMFPDLPPAEPGKRKRRNGDPKPGRVAHPVDEWRAQQRPRPPERKPRFRVDRDRLPKAYVPTEVDEWLRERGGPR